MNAPRTTLTPCHLRECYLYSFLAGVAGWAFVLGNTCGCSDIPDPKRGCGGGELEPLFSRRTLGSHSRTTGHADTPANSIAATATVSVRLRFHWESLNFLSRASSPCVRSLVWWAYCTMNSLRSSGVACLIHWEYCSSFARPFVSARNSFNDFRFTTHLVRGNLIWAQTSGQQFIKANAARFKTEYGCDFNFYLRPNPELA